MRSKRQRSMQYCETDIHAPSARERVLLVVVVVVGVDGAVTTLGALSLHLYSILRRDGKSSVAATPEEAVFRALVPLPGVLSGGGRCRLRRPEVP